MELTPRNAIGHDDRKNSFNLSSRKLVKIINLTGEYQRLEILSPAVAIPRFRVWDNYLTQLCLHTESNLSSVRLAEKIIPPTGQTSPTRIQMVTPDSVEKSRGPRTVRANLYKVGGRGSNLFVLAYDKDWTLIDWARIAVILNPQRASLINPFTTTGW